MASATVNLQDSFLNQVRKESIPVEIMLLNGATFQGLVRGFDNFTIVMHVGTKQHLIYKHSIAQLVTPKIPRKPGEETRHPSVGEKHASPALPHSPSSKKDPPRAREAKPGERFNSLDLSGIHLSDTQVSTEEAASLHSTETREAEPSEQT
jgi:host factor-I protein